MRVFFVGVLLACLHAVHSQSLRHSGDNFPNNSFIDRGIVSVSNNLECLTSHSPCCEGTAVGGWRDPTGDAIQEGAGGTSPFYVTRATREINLNRLSSSNGQEQLSGMYQCQIPGSSGDLEELFIYLGNQSTGQLTSAEVSFTELLSEVNEEPMFVLTCRSQGGPATTVEWIRGSTTISDPSTVLVLVASQQNTMYDSRLTVSGRELGDYSCTISSNRDDYFGEAGSSVSSGAFTVIAAGEPTRLNAVDLLDTERILVTWTAPSGPVTGYTVFLQPGGVQETASAAATSHMFTNVQSGMSYMVTMVALSDQLPSSVVGPVSPTTLEAPTVDLSTTATDPEVGGDLSLNCLVTLPDDIEISGNPLVEFFGPGDGTEEGPFDPDAITPSYLAMYTFEDLDLFSNGDYRCSATYTIEGSNSPPGSDTLTVDVLFESDDPGLKIEGVPYVSNAISLTCAAFISGEEYSIEFVWTKDGGDVPSSTSMGSPPVDPFITRSELIFSSLATTDSGEYQCQVTVSIAATATGNVPTQTVTESTTLNVLTPTVTVNTDPESQRVLDHEDYNSYTITCSAIASVGTSPLELGPVVWERRVDSGVFSQVADMGSLEGSPEEGYTSVLSGSESTPSTSVQFRCTTQLSSTDTFSNSSTSTVTVQGPVPPMSVGLRSTDVTDTTADISWTVPSIAYTPETYVVLYGTTRDNLDRVSSQMTTSGTDISVSSLPRTLRLSGLEPDTAYYYTVNASNSFSFTLYETNSFNTTSRRHNPPTNLAVEIPSDSLTYQFSWTASTDAPGAPPIVKYIVTCDPSLDGIDSVEYTTPDNSTTSGSLTLPPGLSFDCCVVAISEGVGPSDRNCIDPLMTPSTAPSGVPENVVTVAGRRNLTLTWDPPLPPLRNGDISNYTVACCCCCCCCCSSSSSSCSSSSSSSCSSSSSSCSSSSCSSSSSSSSSSFSGTTSDTQVVATGLSPNTLYSCTVLATNGAGSGPSATVTASTLEDVPDGSPQNFVHSVVNGSESVEFSWAPPPSSSANGRIISYTLSCNSTSFPPTTNLNITVTTFTPGTWYSCAVSASTAVGAGPGTTPWPVLTVPGAPDGVGAVERDEEGEEGLLVTWNQVEGIVTGYTVAVSRMTRGDTIVLTSSDFSLLVRSDVVGGFESVGIEVSAVNSAGYGPPSNRLYDTTPSIPPGPVEVLNVTVVDTVLSVWWAQPLFPNGVLTGYTVSVETFQEAVVTLDPQPVDNETFTHQLGISSLEDGTPYSMVVVAVNDKGSGVKNPYLFYSKALMSDPVVLKPEDQKRADNGDILLVWEKLCPVEARGIIRGYEIRFSETRTAEGGRRKRQECPNDACSLGEGQSSGCCRVGADQTNVTISGLDPSRSYDVSVSVVNDAGVGETQTFTIEGRSSSDEGDGDFPVVIVVVVVVLVVVIVLLTVVVVVIVVIIRRKKSGGYKAQNLSPSLDEKMSGGSGEKMVPLSAVNPTSPEEAARMKPIELGRFEEHVRQMHEDRDKGFELEYQTFSTEPTAVHEEAQDPKNKTKNRFANIFPYDFNRVPLQHMDGAEGSDYINASFVHGYSRSNAYIAAQGPMSGTILDFWRMIWEHRPATIVMLTKQVEGGKRKCELYWPEKVGETFKPGSGLHVEYKEVIPFADFEIKKFIVTNAQKSKVPALEVQHFQFLSWPDHGVPKFSTALISFILRLRQYHNPQSSMLVHGSAGVGRTGAFILLDSMLERLASESSMNVYEFLMTMRQQRVHLVQTLAQYVFIHDALVELITCGDTSVPASELRKHILKMSQKEGDGSGFTVQFRLLARVSRKPSDNDNSDGLAPHNKDKNRYPGRVPYNMNRVRLRPTGVSGSEYINASFLDGYKQKNMYMAAQAPVASTVNDFWRMVWEFKSRAVVMLCQLEENGQEMSQEYWPTQPNAKQLYGKNSVKLLSEEHSLGAKEIVVRKFDITDEKNTASFTVTQYHVLCWPEEGKMAPGLLLHLISELNKLQRNTGNMPITVVCNDGMGRTGAFICIHAMLDRVNSEHIVDFFQFIKSSRINRPDIVREEEHYVMCHEAVAEYLDSFQMYANFT